MPTAILKKEIQQSLTQGQSKAVAHWLKKLQMQSIYKGTAKLPAIPTNSRIGHLRPVAAIAYLPDSQGALTRWVAIDPTDMSLVEYQTFSSGKHVKLGRMSYGEY